MLDLKKNQAKILQVFATQYTDKSGVISHGLTEGSLKEYGLEPKTFKNHKKYLLENYLIRITKIEYHGIRWYYYYHITPIGILALFKWVSSQNIAKSVTLNKQFFPLISSHLEELDKKFGKILHYVFQQSIEKISLEPIMWFYEKKQRIATPQMTLSITLEKGSIRIIHSDEVKPKQVEINHPKIPVGEERLFLDNNDKETEKIIQDRFTFLFYYNLMNLTEDSSQMFKAIWEIYEPVNISGKTMSAIPKDELEKINSKFIKTLNQNKPKLLSLIKKDQDLNDLLQNVFDEITKHYSKDNPINAMKNFLG